MRLVAHIVLNAVVGEVEVVRFSGELGSQCIDLLYIWTYSAGETIFTNCYRGNLHIVFAHTHNGACYLEIAKSLFFRLQKELIGNLFNGIVLGEGFAGINNTLQAVEEPLIYFG